MEKITQILITQLEAGFQASCTENAQLTRGNMILDFVLRHKTPDNINIYNFESDIHNSGEALIETLIILYLWNIEQSDIVNNEVLNNKLLDLVITRIQEGKLGFEDGTGAIINYFNCLLEKDLIESIYIERILEALDTVLDTEYYLYMNDGFHQNINQITTGFSIQSGKTGLLLVLMELVHTKKIPKRIEGIVQRITLFIEHQIDYLVQHILPVGSSLNNYSFFPVSFEEENNISTVKNTLGWSKGDLGHILMLEKASTYSFKGFDDNFIERIGSFTLTRKNNLTTEVEHADFGSGSAGIAMMYKQLFKQTGSMQYLSGYEFWKNETIRLTEIDLNLGFFNENHGILEGVLGVILSLHSFVNPKQSLWSEMLMIR